jgi:DNA invertase Pin-like site-specific DNA recombinase
MSTTRKLRCAIYTRKSSEEGLDQAFNSLDAQREACAAYIASQASLGWTLVPEPYDDGGISGGTLERPAIQRLLQHIKDRKIDVVVVYKIDRLTRSLTDFAKLVEVFDGYAVSFVSVTQQFNTTTSMGRLTLNVLLSFAQFEREVTAECIRDKIAASKQKGMWMGGRIPLGYKRADRKLLIDERVADYVRMLFRRYSELNSVSALTREIKRSGDSLPDQAAENPVRKPASLGHLRHILSNPIYIGKLRHRDKLHDGEHEAIITEAMFETVQALLAEKVPEGRSASCNPDIHLLAGLVFDETEDRLAPNHAYNHGKRYRYYISGRLRHAKEKSNDGWRIPATDLENIVLAEAVAILQNRPMLAGWLHENTSTSSFERGLAESEELAVTLQNAADIVGRKQILQTIFKLVTISGTGIRFEVRRHPLMQRLVSDLSPALHDGQTAKGKDDKEDIVVIERPMTIKRRGVEARLVIEGALKRKPDPTLVDLIARAHLYLNRLTDGSVSSIADLATELSVHRADISRILPLAFLSPAIIEAIMTGRQPADLTVRTLSRLMDGPPLWADQAKMLGI